MKIYKLSYELNSDYLHLDLEPSKAYIKDLFKGNKVLDWREIEFKRGTDGELSDFPPYLPQVILFTHNSYNLLQDIIKNKVQILHSVFEGQIIYIINVVNVLDVLNKSTSEIVKFPNGKVLDVRKYEFDYSSIKEEHIFKIPEQPLITYVSDTFVNIVKKNRLKGFKFIQVWDSDTINQGKPNHKYKTLSNEEYSFEDAVNHVLESGKSAISSDWLIILRKNVHLAFGKLQENGDYKWFDPHHSYPPILLDMKWKMIVE